MVELRVVGVDIRFGLLGLRALVRVGVTWAERLIVPSWVGMRSHTAMGVRSLVQVGGHPNVGEVEAWMITHRRG
jgi:hypothetical protein